MTGPAAPLSPQMRRAIGRLDWICLLLATHGSLYPWRFAWPAAGLQHAWDDLWVVTTLWTGLGDVVGNVVLFVPLGVLMLLHLQGSRVAARWQLPAMLLLGTLFAWLLQALQIFVPTRDPELSDVVWNLLGLLVGAGLARLLPHLAAGAAGRALKGHGLALGLVALWLALQWWPLAPTLDWQHVKDALKPLLRDPAWRPVSALEAALGMLALGHLLRGLRPALCLPGLFVLTLAGKLFIAGQAISFSHVVGGVAGLAGAAVLGRQPASRSAFTVMGAALLWLMVDELRPFELAGEVSAFEFIPFIAMLKGSMQANAAALASMVFWLGVVMVLGLQAGARLGGLAAALSLTMLLLEAAQTWLPLRTAEITPALIPWGWLVLLQPLVAAPRAQLSPPLRRRRSAR